MDSLFVNFILKKLFIITISKFWLLRFQSKSYHVHSPCSHICCYMFNVIKNSSYITCLFIKLSMFMNFKRKLTNLWFFTCLLKLSFTPLPFKIAPVVCLPTADGVSVPLVGIWFNGWIRLARDARPMPESFEIIFLFGHHNLKWFRTCLLVLILFACKDIWDWQTRTYMVNFLLKTRMKIGIAYLMLA